MKKFLLLVFFLLASFVFFNSNWHVFLRDGQIVDLVLKENLLASDKKSIKVKVVKNTESIKKGLSGREKIDSGEEEAIEGMLFILPSFGRAEFWMKEMEFDIDICWIENKKISACERDVKAKDYNLESGLKTYESPMDVKMVLETNPYFLTDDQFLKLFPQKSIFFLY